MKLVDQLIFRDVIASTALVSVVIIAIEFFLNMIQQFHFVGQHNYTLWRVFLYVGMQLPAQFYQLFPMAGFLGTMIGPGRLSSSSQLIVIRMVGYSVMQLTGSVTKAAVVMIVVITILGEGIGLHWQQTADVWKKEWIFPQANQALLHSIWLRQGNHFTHIGELNSPDTISDVTRYYFSKNDRLLRADFSPVGKLVNGRWELLNVKQTIFGRHHVTVTTQSKMILPMVFKPVLQVKMRAASTQQSLTTLIQMIRYRRDTGLTTDQFVFALSQRFLQPITTLVMIILAIPFVFGSFRNTTMDVRLLTGIVIGFIFYMLNQLFGPITMVYQFPPLLSAALPTMLFLLLASVLLLRVRS